MDGAGLFFLSLICFMGLGSSEEAAVTVTVASAIGVTDDSFICATLDWWPPNKCNYGQCPWGLASVLNLNLSNPVLPTVIGAFGGLRIRIGGSLQDQVYYKVGESIKKCPSFKKSARGLFGFSRGCLKMDRWDQVYNFLNRSSVKLTFGLNALVGRKKTTDSGLWIGAWDSSNARDFMKYTIRKGQKMDAWELGNELSGDGVAARVDAQRYGKDMIALKQLIVQLYPAPAQQPMILGPGGFFNKKWFSDFLQVSGPNVVNGVTHHIYNLGSGADSDLLEKIRDPDILDNTVQTFTDLKVTLKSAPWAGAWVGEAGGAYNSGSKLASHSFINSFWYVDQLGMAAAFNHTVYCRQSLIGGNYGLLDTATMAPNPDYYSALLWHRLMGRIVLSTRHNGARYLRVYSHCSKKGPGIAVLLINLSNATSFDVSVTENPTLYPHLEIANDVSAVRPREEYHLTAGDGDLESHTMLLNGKPLELTRSGEVPVMRPMRVDASKPITVLPSSIVFATLKNLKFHACA